MAIKPGGNKRCKICNSPNKKKVRDMILWGYSYKQIVEFLNDNESGVIYNQMNVSNHRKHLEGVDLLMSEIPENRRILGYAPINEYYKKQLDMIFQFFLKSGDKILTSNFDLDTKDYVSMWLRAGEILFKYGELEEADLDIRYQQLFKMYSNYVDVVRSVVTEEQMEEIQQSVDEFNNLIYGKNIMVMKAIEGD